MRKDWEYKKLGEVCEVVSGTTPKTNNTDFWGNGYYWITPAEINESTIYVDKTERQITDKALAKTNLRLLPKGTVLLSSRAPIGKVAICDVDMYCNQGFKNCICSDKIVNKYLYYFFIDKNAYLNSLGRGATFKEISKSIVENISIHIPPKSTQLAIVAELDKLNEMIRLKKQQLEDYDQLAQSIFYEMFGDPILNEKGWEVKKLGEISTIERGSGISKKDFCNSGLPCIHYGQIHTSFGAYTKEVLSYIPENLLPKYKYASRGDLIMAITSEDVEGSCKSTTWLGNYDVVIGSDAAICHHSQDGIYLSYYTRTKAFYNEKAKYAKGFKVTHISTKEIASIPIPLPPLPLQQQFAARIEAIEQQKQQVKDAIKDLETLLASRMQYWFDFTPD